MPDKRKINRKFVRTKVRFGSRKPINFGQSLNISPFGIGITSTRTMPLNSKVTINIYTDEKKSEFISASGKIVWAKHSIPGYPGKIGIKFDEPCYQIFDTYDSFNISLSDK